MGIKLIFLNLWLPDSFWKIWPRLPTSSKIFSLQNGGSDEESDTNLSWNCTQSNQNYFQNFIKKIVVVIPSKLASKKILIKIKFSKTAQRRINLIVNKQLAITRFYDENNRCKSCLKNLTSFYSYCKSIRWKYLNVKN